MSMWSTVAVNTNDKHSSSGLFLGRFPCYPMLDNRKATEFTNLNFSTLYCAEQKFKSTK